MISRAPRAIHIPFALLAIALISPAGAAVSSAALLMPDLIVTDFAQKNGVISFTLKNVGTKTAPTGHTTLLAVNGKQVDTALIGVTIAPDKIYTTTFKKYLWDCKTSGQYTLVVTVDGTNKVAEIDEKNNSRQEVWTCDATPPVITINPQAMYITQTSAKVSWTTNENSDSVVKYGTTSGVYKYTESMAVSTTNHAIFLDKLQPDTLYYYVAESTDAAGNTVRSTQRAFRTLADVSQRADLTVVDLWEQDGEVFCRLRNIGAATAPSGHTAALYVDGQLKATAKVGLALAPGGQIEGSFAYAWKCTKPQHLVKVVADSTGVVEEENETNNSREETWTCDVAAPKIVAGPTVSGITQTTAVIAWGTDEKSDSAVRYGTQPGAYATELTDATRTDKHQMQLQNLKPDTAYYFVIRSSDPAGNTVTSTERSFRTQAQPAQQPDLIVDSISAQEHRILFKVKNAGAGPAPGGHKAGLYISDRLVDSQVISQQLDPGEVHQGSFEKFYFECFDPEHTFRVTADIDNRIIEKNETNNSLNQTIACDVTAGPKITSGPAVTAITGQSAVVSWTTDKPSDSNVVYDEKAEVFQRSQASPAQVSQHRLTLAGLTPGVTYQFKVRSTDALGRFAASRPGYFRTTPKADNQRPRISDLTFVRRAGKQPYYKIGASATDDTGVEKVQFLVDGVLLHTDYAAPYEAIFAPGMIGMASAQFYRPHTFEARAVDGSSLVSGVSGLFEPVHDCNDINAEFEWPFPDETFYVPDATTGTGTEIPIQVYASKLDMFLVSSGGGIEAPPGRSGEIWDIVELPVREVRFYVNSTPIGTVLSRENHLYPITWAPVDLPLGDYVIRADAVADDTCIQTITRDIRIERGASELELSRRVWREENSFRIELTVRNTGTVSYFCGLIRDNIDGLQGITETRDSCYVRTDLALDGRECTVDLDVFTDTSDTVEIRPGRSLSVEYRAIPIQFAGAGPTHYAIGEDPVRVTTTALADPRLLSSPCVRTESGRRLASEITSAIESSDYLIVTNPENCRSEFVMGADDVFAQMARLAYHRNGILAYPMGIGSNDPAWLRGWILTWGAAMKGSDGIAGHYLSNGYLLLVGETEILPAWTVDVTDIAWEGGNTSDVVECSDLPYGDTQGADNIPDLITARIIGDDDALLIQAMQAGLDATFDRTYGVVTSGNEGESENFVGSARDIYGAWVDQGAGGTIMTDSPNAHHWSTHVHKEQMNNGHNFTMNAGEGFLVANLDGMVWALRFDPDADTARGAPSSRLDLVETRFIMNFDCPFDRGDALVAGDIDGDGREEVVVGSIANDQIVIGYDFSHGQPAFPVTLEPWDVLACGSTEGGAKEQIVLARTTGGGTIRVYEYDNTGTPSLSQLRTFNVPFTPYDGLAVGDVNAANPGAEILIASDDDDRISIYSNTGVLIARISCDPYSPFDSLCAGDFDGDGVDEIGVLIDDTINDKRRLKIIQNDGWTADGAGGWVFKRNQAHTVYSRFLNFEGARTSGSDTRQDGVACGDLDGDGKEEIAVARESPDRLLVLDGDYTAGWNDRYVSYLQGLDDRIDVFTMRGHGNPGGCSPLGNADVDTLSFDAHPLVFVLSCLTGNYEGDWSWCDPNGTVEAHTDGDDGFAENFFARGAAAYIGATEVSSGPRNDAAGISFFTQWDPTETAGKAFRDYRRGRAATGDASWEYWAMEYNYYGDPKFGAVGATLAAAAQEVPRDTIAAATAKVPGSNEQITIPDYQVKNLDGQDRVTIPGGDVVMENGKPIVPSYQVRWELPTGLIVQDVRLQQRSELKTAIGLVLPFATTAIDADGVNPQALAAANRGWFPAKDFDWRQIPGPDGTSTLVISLYPFFYNSQTTEVRFYRQYVLDVETTTSEIQIAGLSTDQRLYQAGDAVMVNLSLSGTGQAADVIMDMAIRRYGSGETVAGLLLRRLSGLSGSASYSATWDSKGAAPGNYYAETRLVNPAGQSLDRKTCLFKIRSP